MNRYTPRMLRISVCLAACAWSLTSLGQQQASVNGLHVVPTLSEVEPLPYPPMAFAAHVTGDVELDLEIHGDGTPHSVEVTSGPPMLRQAAIAAILHSRFDCQSCADSPMRTHITVRYVFGEVRPCPETDEPSIAAPADSYLKVTHSTDTITVTDRPIGTCDYAATISRNSVRSMKCFFLWKCGWR